MKTLITLIVMGALAAFQPVKAQSDKSERNIGLKVETIAVQGVCGMCKKRIEKAATSVEGVKTATWNEDTKKLLVKYSVHNPEALVEVEKKVAAAGHDAEKTKATIEAYNKLPDCCQYREQ
ncbi:MAG: heavy-metal-associated domain-containing protein [Chitinophagaceae bacterium]|nr:MAG: heavy-metal-associated domain-containing protein [Chitinophagaceae bacterium]